MGGLNSLHRMAMRVRRLKRHLMHKKKAGLRTSLFCVLSLEGLLSHSGPGAANDARSDVAPDEVEV